ncbi:MAG: hypothetical protein JETT_1247 [Candidatus Jettenia ecosi]|uniref:beta-N-acetylhexosaminidase n=1 Tax=Candidatus Jettenia ecosi TaxID=2494326 RepID=A0A533QCL5_9BACT|nr:MAG: hypothetical protein JETT_1247 [Candidatus Jettenia ecosi]
MEDNVPITVVIFSQKMKDSLSKDIVSILNWRESYVIAIGDNIRVIGADELGALHGLTTLERLIIDRKGKIPRGRIMDWPDHKIRALHLVLRLTTPDDIKQLIKYARFGHYNTLILGVADGVGLKTMSRIARKNAWTVEQFLDVVNFAKENGLDIIPNLNLLTHQSLLFGNKYPDLMYNQDTYDPRKEETYAAVLPMIHELIELIHPKSFHIGHDEVAGHNENSKKKKLSKGEKILPAELFLKDVERIHTYLKGRGVETWMWGDMLIAPDEFPAMLARHLHGAQEYASLRDKIPKDIVICDWHYFDKQSEFPSALSFVKDGYRVLGATWTSEETIKNFSRYIANLPTGGEGMIATTWFHVQKKDWNLVNKIIVTSSESFWNAK